MNICYHAAMNEITKKYLAKSFLMISVVNACAVELSKANDTNSVLSPTKTERVYTQASKQHTTQNFPTSPIATLDGITIMSTSSSGDNLGCLAIVPA